MYQASCTIDGRTYYASGKTKQMALNNLDSKLNSIFNMQDAAIAQKVRSAAASATVREV